MADKDLPTIRKKVTSSGRVRDFIHKNLGVPIAPNQLIYDVLGGQSPITEESLTKNELGILRGIVRDNLKSGKKIIEYSDYLKAGSKPTETNSKFMNAAFDPTTNIDNLIGRANINVSNGDTTIVDRYNFNDADLYKDKSFVDYLKSVKDIGTDRPYSQVRNFAAHFGSNNESGSPVDIKINEYEIGGTFMDRNGISQKNDSTQQRIPSIYQDSLDPLSGPLHLQKSLLYNGAKGSTIGHRILTRALAKTNNPIVDVISAAIDMKKEESDVSKSDNPKFTREDYERQRRELLGVNRPEDLLPNPYTIYSNGGNINSNPMKQDKYNPGVYWHGGKMYFTGGAMTDFMKNNKSEIGLVGGAVGQAVESLTPKTSMAGSIGGSALKYGSMGAALGPLGMAGGAVLGAGLGFANAKQAQEQQALEREAQSRDEYAAGTAGRNPYGSIFAMGGDIKPALTTFDGGFKHGDPNPMNTNQGIPQGINPSNGQPNTVENNETKYKNYIFSDQLTLPNAKEYYLGGHFSGKTFSTISKKLSKAAEERPEDPISSLGQKLTLDRLMTANDDAIEMKKFSDENEQFKCGGKMKIKKNKFEYGGYIFNDI